VYYAILNCLERDDYLQGIGLDMLTLNAVICERDDPYYRCRFIELTFRYSNNISLLKNLIQSGEFETNLDIFTQALNAFDEEMNLNLLKNKEISDLLYPLHPNPFFQLHYQIIETRQQYLNHQDKLTEEVKKDNIPTSQIQDMLDVSHALGNEMMQARRNLDEYLELREEKKLRAEMYKTNRGV
jgi:hypothetical protein